MNPDRLIVGLASTWPEYRLSRLLELQPGVECWHDHRQPITGLEPRVGMWRRFAYLDESSGWEPGLYVLGEVDDGHHGDGWLDLLARSLDRQGPITYGLSPLWWTAQGESWSWPREISITSRPKDAGTAVLAVGGQAGRVWELLSGERVSTW